MWRSIIALGFLALTASACRSPFAELILDVDAEEGIVAAIDVVTIELKDGATTIDRFDAQLDGRKPTCLPFSIGIQPNEGHEELPVTIVVRAPIGSQAIEETIETRFPPGTHRVSVMLDRACAGGCAPVSVPDPPAVVDRQALIDSMNAAACRAGIPIGECIDRGGCSTSTTSAICAVPCPLTDPAAPAMPEPPVEVSAPRLGACPPGWSAAAEPDTDGIALCEPWPADAFFGCPRGRARFPGADECRPLGAACPSGEFAEQLPASGVYYVSATATISGDGGRAAPFRRLEEALAVAPEGSIIALSKGAHLVDPAELDRPLVLAGACAEVTQLTRIGASLGPLFTVTSSSVFMRDLTIAGADRGVLVTSGVAHLEGVEIEDSAGSSLIVAGPSAIISSALVLASSGDTALVLEQGAHATISSLDVTGARGGAIRVSGSGAVLRVRDASIRAASMGDAAIGFGVLVEDGAQAELVRSVIEESEAHSVYAAGERTFVSLIDVLVRDTAPAPDGTRGHGVHVQDSAAASLLRVGVARARHSAIALARTAPIVLTDVAVHDTLGQASNREHGYGIGCDGCTLRGGRVSIARATRNAFDLDNGADVVLSDVLVRDTRADENDRSIGTGLVASRGARVSLSRARFERLRLAGLFFQENTIAELSDVVVRDTVAEESSAWGGHGAFVKSGVRFEVKRGVFERNRQSGITLVTGEVARSNVSLENVLVREVRPSLGEPNSGWGLLVAQSGGPSDLPLRLTLRGVALIDTVGAALEAARAQIEATDLEIRGTRPDEADLLGGDGVVLEDGAELEAVRMVIAESAGRGADVRDDGRLRAQVFRIEESAQAGVAIGAGASVDLLDGEIARSAVGVSMSASYDVQRVALRVRFRDNAKNVSRD